MIRQIFASVVAVAAAKGSIAFATAPALADTGAPHMVYEAKTQKFCAISEPITGSYLPVRDCRTAAAWAKAGVTVTTTAKIAAR